ncbi:FAST kinase domain-containing protein 2, mitochondrial [Neosynchiropus ocellatus]
MSVWLSREILKRCVRIRSHRFSWNVLPRISPLFNAQDRRHVEFSKPSSVRFYSGIIEEPGEPTASSQSHAKENPGRLLSKPRSPYIDLLLRCSSPSDVLDLTCKYALTADQVGKSLSQMWTVSKAMSEDQRRYELRLMFDHPAFEKLLQTAIKSLKSMKVDGVVYSLLALVKLGVPQRSRVVQIFLLTCQEKLNSFDGKCLSILATTLEHMERSENIDALKSGMRLIVETHLPQMQNVSGLQTLMRVMGKDAPPALKWRMQKKVLSMSDDFSLPNTQYMLRTMAATGLQSKPLMDVCSKKVLEHLCGIPCNRLLGVLHAYKDLRYKDCSFLMSVSDHLASSFDAWTIKEVILLLSLFEEMVFSPPALMAAFAERVIQNPKALALRDVLCVIRVYSSLNVDLAENRQQFLGSLDEVLEDYLPKMSAYELLKTVYCFCLLGHFPLAPLKMLLRDGTLETLESSDPKFLKWHQKMGTTVSLCLRLDQPVLPELASVPTSLLREPLVASKPGHPTLVRVLRCVAGSQQEVTLQEAVLVENVYHVDCVVTKPLSRTRVADSSGSTERPPVDGAKRIAVLCPPQRQFCLGTSHPRGPLAVEVRHLKSLGYDTLLVSEQQLQSEETLTDFLREHIFPEHHMDSDEI